MWCSDAADENQRQPENRAVYTEEGATVAVFAAFGKNEGLFRAIRVLELGVQKSELVNLFLVIDFIFRW